MAQELYSATGVNWKALLAVFLGAAPCFPGFINALVVHGAEQQDLVSPFWAHLCPGSARSLGDVVERGRSTRLATDVQPPELLVLTKIVNFSIKLMVDNAD